MILNPFLSTAPRFWGFGRPAQSLNARRYYAMAPITSDEEEDDFIPASSKSVHVSKKAAKVIATEVCNKMRDRRGKNEQYNLMHEMLVLQ